MGMIIPLTKYCQAGSAPAERNVVVAGESQGLYQLIAQLVAVVLRICDVMPEARAYFSEWLRDPFGPCRQD